MELYKYQGAGNDFLIADNRRLTLHLTSVDVARLCDRRYGIGADGLMLLEPGTDGCDFSMVYYNSDGSTGMMCGNGGRCIVAFAHHQGLRGYHFLAADGEHRAEIIDDQGQRLIVRLSMKDVDSYEMHDDSSVHGCFMDTGTRHLVCPVVDVDHTDVFTLGRRLRHDPRFAPIGVNVNFIEPVGDKLRVRTYEKGVEAETYACGTGITASAIAAWHYAHPHGPYGTEVHQSIRAVRDDLAIDFIPTPFGAVDVHLTGPATYVAKIEVG